MIKTESGEMIEPRVGDVFLVCKPMNKYIGVLHESGVLLDKEAGFIISYKDSMLTLLHRPFQVGDDVEVNPDGKNWQPNVPLDDFGAAKANKLSQLMVRHKNPAWRDHSKWENKDE